MYINMAALNIVLRKLIHTVCQFLRPPKSIAAVSCKLDILAFSRCTFTEISVFQFG